MHARRMLMVLCPDTPVTRPKLGKRAQLGYVVEDMEDALKYWIESLGVGPFVVFDTSVGDRQFIHRGRPTAVEYSIAFSYIGDLQVELIHQVNDAPSLYKEFLDTGRAGLHHLAFWPEDFEGTCAELEQAGFSEISSINLRDGTKNVSYFETPRV